MRRLKPKQPQLSEVMPNFKAAAMPYFKAAAMLYTAIVMLLPLIAFVMTLVNKTGTGTNLNWIYVQLVDLLRLMGSYMPGDYLLASVAILYLKKWQVSVGLLIAGGFLWLISWSCSEVIGTVAKIGDQSIVGLVMSTMYAALAAQLLLCSLLLPAFVAQQRKKSRWKLLAGLNIALGWIPPLWVLLLFLAFRNDKVKPSEVSSEEVSDAKAARKVHQNLLKKKKGFKKR